MRYYTGDLHFGHENVLRFDNRPFANVDEQAGSENIETFFFFTKI